MYAQRDEGYINDNCFNSLWDCEQSVGEILKK